MISFWLQLVMAYVAFGMKRIVELERAYYFGI